MDGTDNFFDPTRVLRTLPNHFLQYESTFSFTSGKRSFSSPVSSRFSKSHVSLPTSNFNLTVERSFYLFFSPQGDRGRKKVTLGPSSSSVILTGCLTIKRNRGPRVVTQLIRWSPKFTLEVYYHRLLDSLPRSVRVGSPKSGDYH